MIPVISVIIPCYNQGSFIDEAVDSVLDQTFKDFEIIIINDGSTDGPTISKLKNYNKPFCKVIHTENRGLSAARNEGIREAKGKYLQFLDADDVLKKEKFELQISVLESAPDNSLSYCDYFPSTESDLESECPKRYLTPVFKTDNFLKEVILDWQIKISIPCHCFLFNSKIFRENNIFFDETLPNHEDWACWVNVFSLNPGVYYIEEKLATYRIREGSMSRNAIEMKEGFLKAIKNLKSRFLQDDYISLFLTEKQNLIKYGYQSRFSGIALIGGVVKKNFKRVKKVLAKYAY